MAGALGGLGDEQFRAGDDLEAAGVMLADPGLVVIELVEMDEQLHVAVEAQQGVFAKRMKRGEKNSGLQVSVVHGPSLPRAYGF